MSDAGEQIAALLPDEPSPRQRQHDADKAAVREGLLGTIGAHDGEVDFVPHAEREASIAAAGEYFVRRWTSACPTTAPPRMPRTARSFNRWARTGGGPAIASGDLVGRRRAPPLRPSLRSAVTTAPAPRQDCPASTPPAPDRPRSSLTDDVLERDRGRPSATS